MALTMIGRGESTDVVGRALRDEDRGVRMIAEDGLPAMWRRVGGLDQRQVLAQVTRLGAAGRYPSALAQLDQLLESADDYADAWYCRAEVNARAGSHCDAVAAALVALKVEPYHYLAAMLSARSYYELGDLPASIASLKRVLKIHPHWEVARNQLRNLQRVLREQTDC